MRICLNFKNEFECFLMAKINNFRGNVSWYFSISKADFALNILRSGTVN